MSLRNRLERAENSIGVGCRQHHARVVRDGGPDPVCERCGEPLLLVRVPAKRSRDEWIESAADLATRNATKRYT
jgi:hypothetical protein